MDSLLYEREYQVGEHITLNIPTIGEIIDAKDGYYRTLDLFTAMPIDYMVQLDDMGVDFTEIDNWQLFLMLFRGFSIGGFVAGIRSDLFFKNIDLSEFELAIRESTEEIVLVNQNTDVIIDRQLYNHISDAMCMIYGRKRNEKRPGNKAAKEYMIEVERKKQRRRRRKSHKTEFEILIVALVNNENFKYNFATVRDLTIYQFNESVKQVLKKTEYDNRMHGVYSGTLDASTLSQDDLNWLVHD